MVCANVCAHCRSDPGSVASTEAHPLRHTHTRMPPTACHTRAHTRASHARAHQSGLMSDTMRMNSLEVSTSSW